MPRHIVYHAASPSAVQACAYSLLKYLGLYNLKPPADHYLTVFTNDPAALEAFGPFFHSFELKPLEEHASGLSLARAVAAKSGSTLYMGNCTYPVAPLGPLFEGLEKGGDDGGEASPAGAADAPVSRRDSLGAFIAGYDGLPEFALLLKTFFSRHGEESIPNQVKLVQPIDAVRILSEKKTFRALPFYQKIIRKITGRGWQIARYGKKW